MEPDHFDISLVDKVEFLQKPEVYLDKSTHIEAIETHMSWVFLGKSYAYKLKKPVHYPFLDFSTIDARHRDCDDELMLNRRLARDIYLEVVPLTVDAAGHLQLDAPGQVVDWLVKMQRLPADCMLDHRIVSGLVTQTDIIKLALVLADFYKAAVPIEISTSEYKQRFKKVIAENRCELTQACYELSVAQVRLACDAQLTFLKENGGLFDARVRQGRIIEAHGDLRPEHICIGSHPVIIDCLQFNREFRLLDAADELAFLAMECELLGASDIGTQILDVYREMTSDEVPGNLLAFYKSYRAAIRAKLSVWHLQDTVVSDPGQWKSKGKTYMRLANRHADQL